MKFFDWSEEKNALLKLERDVSFEDIVVAVESGQLLDILEHPNKEKYQNQSILVVNVNNYAYLVPYVENETSVFLKSIIPSRKATKQYIIEKGEP